MEGQGDMLYDLCVITLFLFYHKKKMLKKKILTDFYRLVWRYLAELTKYMYLFLKIFHFFLSSVGDNFDLGRRRKC